MDKISKCPSCNSNNFKIVINIDNNNIAKFKALDNLYYDNILSSLLNFDKIKIAKCNMCLHHWYVYQPSNQKLSFMYSNKSFKDKNSYVHKKNIEKNILILKKISPGKDFLDFGSGLNNLWESIANKHNLNYFGYDPYMQKKKRLKNYFNSLSELNNKKFDIINVNQVLEHVKNLDKTLDEIKMFCKKETIIKISVPNVLRPREKYIKKFYTEWPYNNKSLHTMSPYEHLHGFTAKSLKKLFLRKNFSIKHSFKILFFFNHFYIRQYLNNLIPVLSTTEMIFKFNIKE